MGCLPVGDRLAQNKNLHNIQVTDIKITPVQRRVYKATLYLFFELLKNLANNNHY